ncbi:putative thiamin biosynthesis lipoprotein ApbE [Alkalibacterium sp. AK22]|uniref:FAD:protein FMN transferase n=1 Tax=Alkalibacterium sp. AK22 TaxID=1229520 RepID=UPI00044FBB62|nr:FAD:protein FMN transferase [Alkalibacterium sp. AK22]EXJ23793.1 putative thiamin biosynthesis lipoprotein ApbE [Alkalibacterium sp. AK22]
MFTVNKKIGLALLVPVVSAGLAACGESDPRGLANEPYDRTEFLLGTVANIRVYNEGKEEALDKAFDRVQELDEWFSMQNPDSEISEVNRQAGIEPVEVSEEVFLVMERALHFAKESDGSFDPTIGAVTSLWGIGQEYAAVPDPDELAQAVDVVDFNKVELNEENQTIYLQEEGMVLDLGAIAKGYITDEAARVLVEEGVNTAIIDLGGDIVVVGNSTRGEDQPWNVGIQNPYGDRGQIIGMVPVSDRAIVTSGIYERLVRDGEDEYHHLMNPDTGFPFENNISGISVIADNAMDADAIANIAFSKGVEAGLEYINSLEDVEVIYTTGDWEVFVSEGLKDSVQISDDDFERAN